MTIKFDLGHDLERWGVWIYRIVTGVTSDIGVPSTRLVADDVMSSVIRNTLSVWWRLFHVHSLVRVLETKRMK